MENLPTETGRGPREPGPCTALTLCCLSCCPTMRSLASTICFSLQIPGLGKNWGGGRLSCWEGGLFPTPALSPRPQASGLQLTLRKGTMSKIWMDQWSQAFIKSWTQLEMLCTNVSLCQETRECFQLGTRRGSGGRRGGKGNPDLASKGEAADNAAGEEREFLVDVHGVASLGSQALWRRKRSCPARGTEGHCREGRLTAGQGAPPHLAELLG